MSWLGDMVIDSKPQVALQSSQSLPRRFWIYRKISNIRQHQISKLKFSSSRHDVVFVQYIETSCQIGNKDVVGAAPTGGAPTASDWSKILMPTKVRLILEVWLTSRINPIIFNGVYMHTCIV